MRPSQLALVHVLLSGSLPVTAGFQQAARSSSSVAFIGVPRLQSFGLDAATTNTYARPLLTTALYSTTSPKDAKTPASSSTSWEESHDDEDEHEDVDASIDEDDDDNDNDSDDAICQEYQQWLQAIEKAQKALHKKQTSLENERSKAKNLESTVARAQLIVNNLYLFNDNSNNNNKQQPQVYQVVDWEQDGVEIELSLDPQYESASAEADALFAQARKLKRGSQVVQELLEDVQQAQQVLQDCQADLESTSAETQMDPGRLRLVQDRLRRTSSSTQFQEPNESNNNDGKNNSSRRQQQQQQNQNANKKKPALGTPASNVRKLMTPNGATVLVGRNRRGNEFLTFTQARGNDIWMHARGTPGAHVLVLDRRGSVHPTEACLDFAAHLAAFYSDGRAESKVPVTVAEPKHLLKPRGAPLGAVKLREEGKVLYGCPELVPEELVVARAQSGLSEEYRNADKAKHRKQTANKQQQRKKQRRQQQQKQQQRRTNKQQEDNDV